VLGCVQAGGRARPGTGLRAVAREDASEPGHSLRRCRFKSSADSGRKEIQMAFQVESLSIELIEALRPIIPRIKRHDRSLADQLARAASSISLNIAESNYSDPGNRKARLFTAAGSANETRAALRVAVAWGYVVLSTPRSRAIQ